MHRVRSALVALLVVFLVSVAPAGAITNGTPDTGHPYVGAVIGSELCSGTLISSSLVLTAGHCTSGQSRLWVSFDQVVTQESNVVTGTPYTHPNFCLGCASGLPGYATFDVGVVVLDTPVDWVGYGALPYEGQVNDLWNGATLTAVGYGVQDFVQGQPTGIQERMYAPVSFINNNHKMADMFIKHSTNPGQGQGGTCWGDSGGPIFADDQITVLGVTSFGGGNCNSNAYAQRIDHPEVLSWLYANFAI